MKWRGIIKKYIFTLIKVFIIYLGIWILGYFTFKLIFKTPISNPFIYFFMFVVSFIVRAIIEKNKMKK